MVKVITKKKKKKKVAEPHKNKICFFKHLFWPFDQKIFLVIKKIWKINEFKNTILKCCIVFAMSGSIIV